MKKENEKFVLLLMAILGGFIGVKIVARLLNTLSWGEKQESLVLMMGGLLIPMSGITVFLVLAEYFIGYFLAIGLHCLGIIFIIPELKKIRREYS